MAISSDRPLRRETGRPWWQYVAAGAASVTAVGVVVLVTFAALGRSPSNGAGGPTVLSGSAQSVLASLLGSTEVHAEERRVLLAALEQRRATLPPGSVAAIREGLSSLDLTLEGAAAALRKDPTDIATIGLLVRTWRQELELLGDARRLLERVDGPSRPGELAPG